VRRAVEALTKHVAIKAREKNESKTSLFEEDEFISVTFTLKKAPVVQQLSLKPKRVKLAHPLYGEGSEICVIVKDPQKYFKDLFLQEGISVSKVIGISKLRKNYKTYEAKRQLCQSYDVFFADDRVIHYLQLLLGKAFLKRKKQPLLINLSKTKSAANEMNKARISTTFVMGSGTTSAVKVARTNMTTEQICENIVAAVSRVAQLIPKKWKNIQAIHIKTNDSVALPIFNSLPLSPAKILANQRKPLKKKKKKKTTENKKDDLKEEGVAQENQQTNPESELDGK